MMTFLAKLACAGLLAVAASGAMAQDDAMYRGLGGKPGIKKIVDNLLPLLLADPRIKESFVDIDMKNLAMRLEEQFCQLSGGPCTYGGKDMREIHDGLNITNAQFNALAEDLQLAMDKAGVASRYQNKLLAKLAPMQRDIVTK
jgi:hemoglobin